MVLSVRALALAGALVLATSGAAALAQAPAETVHVDIAAQDLSSALNRFGRQTGREIVFSPDVVRGKKAMAVKGDLPVDLALDKLLEGTGLTARHTARGAIVVEDPVTTSARTAPELASAGDSPAGDDIIVTGFRRSLRESLQEKRNGDRVQEVLSAEDIGKLPEASIAEALARLPGLATNRDRGNGTEISIRGLGPNLVNTLLNGREIVSAEASRNVRYEQYPAELINGAYVYKSPTAAQVEGAVAGQIDLRTIKPLDFSGTRVVVNLRGIYSDLADEVQDTKPLGWIASASFITQLADGKLGLALGYSGRRQAVATVRTNIFRYTNSFADLNGDGQGNDNIPYGFEALARGGDDIRHGVIAAVQWKPADAFELNGDFFYSHVKFDETQRGFRIDGLPFGNTLSNATVIDGFATGITTTNAGTSFGQAVRDVNELFFFKDDLYAGGLNARWHPERWLIAADIGYSTTHRDQQFLTLRTEPFGVVPTSTFLTRPGDVPVMTFTTNLADPNINRIADFQIPENGGGAPLINDELLTLSADFQREIDSGVLQSFQFGARMTDRSKDYTQRTQFGFIDPAARIPVPSALLNDPVRFPGAYASIPSTLSIDILDAVSQLFGPINPTESFFDQRSSWDVSEKTYAGYAQLNLDGSLFGMDMRGNAGLRVVRTNTLSKSTHIDQTLQPNGSVVNTATPVAVRNEFTDWLPNLNLTLKPSDEIQIRLGASKAIARAPLDDLNAGFGVFTFGAPSAFGGNPHLEPFRSNQLDATFEWYFDRDSALTIAGFYKDLDTYIVQQVTTITVPNPAGGPPLDGTFRQPVNGKGGSIKGFEIMFQKAFTFLPKPLDGLGVYLNYSYTDSGIKVVENDNAIGTIALPGLSKHVGNATFYYSKSGFEARIAWRYRSTYAAELGDTDRILYTKPETVLDFQTSYDFPKHSALSGLRLLFQANNLTDEPFETYYGDTRLQGRYERFGRRYLFGASYQF